MQGANTGRNYALLTIYVKNRVNGAIKFDFHTFSIFNLDGTDYGTATSFDTDQFATSLLTQRDQYMDMSFATQWRPSSWRNRVDGSNQLIPFAYNLDLLGRDADGDTMALVASMDPQDPPAPVGGPATAGMVTMQNQANTGSYFQTTPLFAGTITYKGVTESVTGSIGHIDRQFFPLYAGVNAGPNSRNYGHEWRSIHLDNDDTVSIWRQYSRENHNQVVPFTGATRFRPSTEVTDFDPTFTQTITSYVKYPVSFNTLVPPIFPHRYMPSEHSFEVPGWDLQLTGVPITPVPAHGLPVEYMSGPMNYTGTLNGNPVTGFGSYERTLALYRRWELAEVVKVSVTNLPPSAFQPGGATLGDLQTAADQVIAFYDANNIAAGDNIIDTQLTPGVATLAPVDQPFLFQLLSDIKYAPVA